MNHPIVFLLFFLTIILTGLSTWKIRSLLKRIRRIEHDLQTAHDQLEIIVLERTRELQESHFEKIAGLYRMAEFGRLSSGLFHDLMHPLQGVIAAVDACANESSPETVSRMKQSIVHASYASRRMGNFLGTIRKQINPTNLDELFSLNKELREAVNILRFRARTNHVIISTKESKELFTFGNPMKFHRIALNLIGNAIDACETVSDQESKHIHVRLSKFDGQAMLKITDHGCGIPAHLIEKVFDPFFTTKPQHQGMGLGLSTTERIVKKDFGGTITVTSTEGKGSCFTVTIPIRKPMTNHL